MGGIEPNDAKPQMSEKGWDADVTSLNHGQEHSPAKTLGGPTIRTGYQRMLGEIGT